MTYKGASLVFEGRNPKVVVPVYVTLGGGHCLAASSYVSITVDDDVPFDGFNREIACWDELDWKDRPEVVFRMLDAIATGLSQGARACAMVCERKIVEYEATDGSSRYFVDDAS